jgi:hypothetical protein
MTDSTTYEKLAAPFALSEHAKVNKGGMDQTYAPWTEYVERMNAVLGVGQWSVRIVREGFTDTECWVLAEVEAIIDGALVVRQQYGCEPITKGRDAKPTTDLLKSTASDAIKKAVSLLGPGLYLSVKEERVAIEAAMREAVLEAAAIKRANDRPKPAPSTPKVAAAAVTGADPTVLKTKAELAADLKKGLEYARSLGLEPDDVDPAPLNRAQIEETIDALRQQCREVLFARKQQASS